MTAKGTQRLLRDIACVERLVADPRRSRQDARARLEALLGPSHARALLARLAPATRPGSGRAATGHG